MKENQFKLISFGFELSESKQHFNTFFKFFGEIEHVSVLLTFKQKTSNFKLKLKDNFRNIFISL